MYHWARSRAHSAATYREHEIAAVDGHVSGYRWMLPSLLIEAVGESLLGITLWEVVISQLWNEQTALKRRAVPQLYPGAEANRAPSPYACYCALLTPRRHDGIREGQGDRV